MSDISDKHCPTCQCDKDALDSDVLEIMGAVRQICYGRGASIPKWQRADLRKRLRKLFALDVVTRIEDDFYKNC